MSQALGLFMKNDQLNFPRLLSLLTTIWVKVDFSDFTNLYEFTRIYANLREFVRIYTNLSKFVYEFPENKFV